MGRNIMGKEQEAMTTRQQKTQPQLAPAAVRIFAANDRMNQLLIEQLDPAVWTAKSPARSPEKPPGNVRTIAAIFTHMHNVRTKWIRLTAPHLKVPPLSARRCLLKRSPVPAAASMSF